ncbi:F-actin-capping protein subunit alpha, partial [Dimargaris verticillata]
GTAKVVVHYYEDGNVQLNSNKVFTFELDQALQSDPEALASATLRKIKQGEKEFQLALNDSYHQLAESTFKGLRRNLPVTRNKVDWDKILGYKLGSELLTKE